jgi:hypothetical protein
LPLRHNDGRPVCDDILNQTREELVERFDGVSIQPQSILGIWVHDGVRYEDTSVRPSPRLDPGDLPQLGPWTHDLEVPLCQWG